MKITIKGLKLTQSQKLIYDAANDKQHKYVFQDNRVRPQQ